MTSTIAPREERRLLGIMLTLLAYVLFTAIDSSAKWLAQAGIPTMEFIFVRYAVHLGLILGLFLPGRGVALFRSGNRKLEVLRGLFLLSTTFFNFLAVQFLPLTVTGSIAFTMPLLLCALSVPLLGETVGWRRWTAIGVGFLGVLIIVRPGTDAFHPAALLSLMGAAGSACYFILTRKLSAIDSAATQQFYAGAVAMLCVAPFAFGSWVWPATAVDWFAFALIGVAGFAGHQLSTIALRFAPATVLAPFAYFQIIYMTLSSWLVFAQPPDAWIFLGAPVVIGSGLYIWLRERRLAKPVTPVAKAE